MHAQNVHPLMNIPILEGFLKHTKALLRAADAAAILKHPGASPTMADIYLHTMKGSLCIAIAQHQTEKAGRCPNT